MKNRDHSALLNPVVYLIQGLAELQPGLPGGRLHGESRGRGLPELFLPDQTALILKLGALLVRKTSKKLQNI